MIGVSLLGVLLLSSSAPATPVDMDAVRDAADCMINADFHGAADLAKSIPGSPAEEAAFTTVGTMISKCFDENELVETSGTRSMVVGQVAEQLYRKMGARFSSRVTHEDLTTISLAQAIGRRTEGWPLRAAMAECIVSHSPNEVSKLIRTRAGSKSEDRAIKSVSATFPLCVDAGKQLSVDRTTLRGELARAFFRYLAVPPSMLETLVGAN